MESIKREDLSLWCTILLSKHREEGSLPLLLKDVVTASGGSASGVLRNRWEGVPLVCHITMDKHQEGGTLVHDYDGYNIRREDLWRESMMDPGRDLRANALGMNVVKQWPTKVSLWTGESSGSKRILGEVKS
ncbi:hypothetical protein ACLOJK_022932 [Asimina triloba]